MTAYYLFAFDSYGINSIIYFLFIESILMNNGEETGSVRELPPGAGEVVHKTGEAFLNNNEC